jgi:uncharacterized membrane protein
MIITFLFTGIIIAMTPYITRRETVFGVLIPEGRVRDSFILKKKRNFSRITFGLSVLMSIPLIVFSGGDEGVMNAMAVYITIAIIVYIIIAYGIYYSYHKGVKAFKETFSPEERSMENQKIIVSTDFAKENIVVSNVLFAVINIIIIIGTIIIPIYFFDRIPYEVPTHWGPDGQVTTYTDRSISMFLTMPIMQLVMLGIMIVANHGIKVTKQKLNVARPKASRKQIIAFRYAMSKFLFGIATLTTLMFLMIQYFMVFGVQDGNYILIATGVITVFAVGGALYIAVKYGQGGERLKVSDEEVKLEAGENYDDDRYWKAGLIYINPKDPAVWVETRFGMGMTMNFGNKVGIMILVGILLAVAFITVLPFLLGM